MLYDKVIFVCRDNICQSPAAVTILNSIKKDEWLEVSSRGLVVLFSEPYSMKIHSLLRNHGIIMDNGVSRPLEEKRFWRKHPHINHDESTERQNIIRI